MRLSLFVPSLVVLLGASRAHAESSPIRLTYSVGSTEDCPDEAFFRREVAARLGTDPFTAGEATRSLNVVVDSKSARRTVTVTMLVPGQPAGKRVVVAPPDSCSELVANAALAASVAIDSATRAAAADPPPAAKTEAKPEPAPIASPPSKEQPAPPAPSRASFDVSVRAGVGVSNGVLPSTAFGVSIGGSLRSRSFSFGLDGRFDFPTETSLDTPARGSLRASLVTGAVHACAHFGPVRFEPYVCAAGWVGALRGASAGFAGTKEDVSAYIAAGPRLGALVPIVDHVALDLRIETPFILAPIEMRIADRAQWRSPIVGVVAGAGLVLTRL